MTVGELISVLSDFQMEAPISLVTATVDDGRTGIHCHAPQIVVYKASDDAAAIIEVAG